VRHEAQRLNNPKLVQKGRGEVFVGEDGEVTGVGRTRRDGDGDGDGDGKRARGPGGSGDAAAGEEVDVKLRYVNATLEECDDYTAKTARKKDRAAAEGWMVHSMETKYKTYEKRVATLPHVAETSEAADAVAAHRPTPAQLDSFVADLAEQEKVRMDRRRKRHYEGKDVNYISEANKTFVEKAGKHYDKYTSDVANALERGSA
jgi:hypothetical protein